MGRKRQRAELWRSRRFKLAWRFGIGTSQSALRRPSEAINGLCEDDKFVILIKQTASVIAAKRPD
jgi:hypothetical protein